MNGTGVLRVFPSEQAVRILEEGDVLHDGLPLNSRSAEFVCPLSLSEVVEGEGGGERIKFWGWLRGSIGGSFDVEWVHLVRMVPAVSVNLVHTGESRRNARE